MREALKFVTCLQIILFLKKSSVIDYYERRGLGDTKWMIFCDHHDKCMTLNGLKLQPII